MPYRRTENVVRRQAARHDRILLAAREAAASGGIGSVQIANVAQRADIAAGTVYRYFPAKTDLVAAMVSAISEEEIRALRRAADAAPGPLSALAAAIVTFLTRAMGDRRLAWAVLSEADGESEAARRAYRATLTEEFSARIALASSGGHLPAQDANLSAPALVGALIEGLIGPLAPDHADARTRREAVQMLTLFALRGLGVVDARARGLVVQSMPSR